MNAYHRITELFGLEVTFKDLLVQPLLLKAPSNLTLNTSNDGAFTIPPANLSHQPHSKKGLPYI